VFPSIIDVANLMIGSIIKETKALFNGLPVEVSESYVHFLASASKKLSPQNLSINLAGSVLNLEA